MRVLCLGDSITKGSTNDALTFTPWGGYRGHLWTRLWPDYDVRPVGSMTDDAGNATGPAQFGGHEGHPGWTIAQLRAHVDGWMTTHTPDVVLLLTGIPDGVAASWSTANIYPGLTNQLADLMVAIGACAPDRLILLGTVPPAYAGGAAGTAWSSTWNTACLHLALQTARNGGARCRLVRVADDLLATDTIDGLHPNDGGYVKMTDRWYDALVHPPAPLRLP